MARQYTSQQSMHKFLMLTYLLYHNSNDDIFLTVDFSSVSLLPCIKEVVHFLIFSSKLCTLSLELFCVEFRKLSLSLFLLETG